MTMDYERPKTREEIFREMHGELRSWNKEIPESPDRMDPVLRILLSLYADQLASIDRKISDTWTQASNALIRSICPECMRWPVPAFTVMKAVPVDPVIHVDPHTSYMYEEERQDGKTFYFTSIRREKILKAALKHLFLVHDGSTYDISPSRTAGETAAGSFQKSSMPFELYAAIEYEGPADDFSDCSVFLSGDEAARRLLRWAKWIPFTGHRFEDDAGFSPGLSGTFDETLTADGKAIEWGGLRNSSDLFKPLENSFVTIPGSFSSSWQRGIDDEGCLELPENSKKYYWIRLIIQTDRIQPLFESSIGLDFDCYIAINRQEHSLFKHTGNNRLIEIEMPEESEKILEIGSVTDSNERSYVPRYEALASGKKHFYSIAERKGRLYVWLDFSSEVERPPASVSVVYSTTGGKAANGIEAGKITEFYERHPGIESIRNLVTVSGAIPAKSEQQIMTEISERLRSRDRAMSYDQIVKWSMSFDKRIRNVICEKSVIRTGGGVRKCTVVKVEIEKKEFYSDDEVELLVQRLQSFLKARTAINSQFKVEIVRE